MDDQKPSGTSASNGLKAVAGIVFAMVVFFLFKENKGYQWLHNLNRSNLEIIKQNPDLTYQQKMQAKLNFNYQYLDFVIQQTPDTALILFPDREALTGFNNLNWFFHSDIWKSYFLYPRKAISTNSPYYDSLASLGRITHVAVINKVGYELLPYQINTEKAPKFHILPLDRSKLTNQ